MQLRDMASAYAPSSIIPNGVEKIIAIGGIFVKSGSIVVDSAEKAKPVEYAEKIPHATPNPGMNMGNASWVLCKKICTPKFSFCISAIIFSNSSKNAFASSSGTSTVAPMENVAEKTTKKTKNRTILCFSILSD